MLARRAARGQSGERAARRQVTARSVRFSAKGLRAQRKRLALSAGNFGRLVGTSAQSVYNWEHEKAVPRAAQVTAIRQAARAWVRRRRRARLAGG